MRPGAGRVLCDLLRRVPHLVLRSGSGPVYTGCREGPGRLGPSHVAGSPLEKHWRRQELWQWIRWILSHCSNSFFCCIMIALMMGIKFFPRSLIMLLSSLVEKIVFSSFLQFYIMHSRIDPKIKSQNKCHLFERVYCPMCFLAVKNWIFCIGTLLATIG